LFEEILKLTARKAAKISKGMAWRGRVQDSSGIYKCAKEGVREGTRSAYIKAIRDSPESNQHYSRIVLQREEQSFAAGVFMLQ
jgi:hypothetical protein